MSYTTPQARRSGGLIYFSLSCPDVDGCNDHAIATLAAAPAVDPDCPPAAAAAGAAATKPGRRQLQLKGAPPSESLPLSRAPACCVGSPAVQRLQRKGTEVLLLTAEAASGTLL